MTIDVTKHLSDEEQSEFHEKLLAKCLADVKRSRGNMSKYYPRWDLQNQVYKGERWPDREDRKNQAEGKPEKMIVPTTRSQIESFVAFLFTLFTQNATPYELQPKGQNDWGKKWEDCESVLSRDCSKANWHRLIFQFLLDVGRFGLGILETSWTKESVKVWVAQQAPMLSELNGIPLEAPAASGYQDFLKFEGNRVRSISPYRWFPDTDFPICDFTRGKFCAHEEDYTIGNLKDMEASGEVSGIKWIKPVSPRLTEFRGGESRFSFGEFPNRWSNSDDSAPVVVTKMRKKIVPKDYLMDGKPIGPEEFQVFYTIWYANDNRIIKCEPVSEWHQEYNYSIGQYSPDMHELLSLGLADILYPLQDVISWYVNSHISSVRRVIQNRMILNPTLINTKSYDGEGDIFMNKGFARTDPRLAISQLPAQDVTAGHMGDVDTLSKLCDTVSGVNNNLQGQANTGRRSAQENRVQTAGAASRLKMGGELLWESGFGRNGKLMLSNSRQSLSLESFARAIGLDQNDPELQERYIAFQGTPEEIICDDDYLIFDSTLSSEKGYEAQQLQEFISILLQANPAAALQIAQGVDLVKIVEEMFYLRNGTPIERFRPEPGSQVPVAPQLLPTPQPAIQ